MQQPPLSNTSHIIWPAIPNDINVAILTFNQQLAQSEYWPAHKMSDLQARNITNIMGHARKEIPYYRKILHSLRNKIKNISHPLNWSKVPLLTPRELIKHSPEIQVASPWDSHGKVIRNTVFMGQNSPVTLLSNSYSEIIKKALLTRFYHWNDVDFNGLLVEIRSQTKKDETPFPDWGIALKTGKRIHLNAAMGPEKIMERIAELNPDYLSLPAQLLSPLIKEYQKKQYDISTLKKIFYGGKPIARSSYDHFEKATDVQITGRLEIAGLGIVAAQCLRGNFHLNAEYYLAELLDGDKKLCRDGETGRLIISTLHHYNMPLIRFDTGLTVKETGGCSCGKTLMAFQVV